MASRLATVRTAVRDAIATRRDPPGAGYVDNSFEVEAAYLPRKALEELTDPHVWVIGMGGDEMRLTRSRAVDGEQPIQVMLQRQVDLDDLASIDVLAALLEQLRDTCRGVAAEVDTWSYGWLRTEALKDPNELPYSLVQMREKALFEGAFVAVYKFVGM